jgi:hypothetical protein
LICLIFRYEGMKFTHEGMKFTHEGMKFTHEGMKFTHEDMKFTHKDKYICRWNLKNVFWNANKMLILLLWKRKESGVKKRGVPENKKGTQQVHLRPCLLTETQGETQQAQA